MPDSEDKIEYKTSTSKVLILFFCLLCLLVLLFFLYKKLNKEANGEYTIRRIVYKEGGVRDRVRGTALALGTRLGVQLWPHSNEDGEEMQEVQDEEGQVEGGGSQGSDTEGYGDDEEEDNEEQTKGEGGDTSDDNSSLEDVESEGRARLLDEPEVKEKVEEKREEKPEKVGEEQAKVEASGGAGLLIDLKQFSGSAIWSEEEGGEGQGCDVTPL